MTGQDVAVRGATRKDRAVVKDEVWLVVFFVDFDVDDGRLDRSALDLLEVCDAKILTAGIFRHIDGHSSFSIHSARWRYPAVCATGSGELGRYERQVVCSEAVAILALRDRPTTALTPASSSRQLNFVSVSGASSSNV